MQRTTWALLLEPQKARGQIVAVNASPVPSRLLVVPSPSKELASLAGALSRTSAILTRPVKDPNNPVKGRNNGYPYGGMAAKKTPVSN